MCGFFGGNDSPPPAPVYPSPPPREELMDVFDHIAGSQTVTAIGPDGRKIRVTSRMPRTEEEQRFWDLGAEYMTNAMTKIQELSQTDPNAVVDFSPFIETMTTLNQERGEDLRALTNLPDFDQFVQNLKDMRKRVLEDEFKRQENEGREYLIRRGYGDSTAAIEMRNTLGKNKAQAFEQNEAEAPLYGEQVRAATLANRQAQYNLREQGRLARLQQAHIGHQLNVDQYNQRNAARQQALQNQFNLFKLGAGLRGEDVSRAMASRAPDLANTIFQQSNLDNLNRYQAQINQINAQYQNQLAQYQATPPSFGDTLMNLGGKAAMMYATGGFGGFGNFAGMNPFRR